MRLICLWKHNLTQKGGRSFPLFLSRTQVNVINEANRECLAIDIGTSIPSARLIRTLKRLIDYYGKSQAIRLDNGPEMTSRQ